MESGLLNFNKVTEVSKREFATTLKKLHEVPCDDTFDITEERKMELFDKTIRNTLREEDLLPEELEAFRQSFERTNIDFVAGDDWRPWWHIGNETQASQFVEEVPSSLKNPAHICCTTSRQTALLVFQDIIETLLTYTCLVRFTWGDWTCLGAELKHCNHNHDGAITFAFLTMCENFTRKTGKPSSSALVAAEVWVKRMQIFIEEGFVFISQMSEANLKAALLDTSILISSATNICRVLSELSRIIARERGPHNPNCKEALVDKIHICSKGKPLLMKLRYFSSFIHFHTSPFTFKGGLSIPHKISLIDNATILRLFAEDKFRV